MAIFKKTSDYYKPTEYFEPTQPNPTEVLGKGKKGDCAIRAFCIAMGISWLEAFDILVENGRKNFNVPNDAENIYDVLRQMGCKEVTERAVKGKKRLTTEQFAKEHPTGRYIVRCADHLSAVVDGKIRDSWNTSNRCVYRYFELEK